MSTTELASIVKALIPKNRKSDLLVKTIGLNLEMAAIRQGILSISFPCSYVQL